MKAELNRALIVATVRELLTQFGPHFLPTLEAYLNAKYNATLDIAGEDPSKFYRAVEELFGEFGASMFFYTLLMELHLKPDKRDKETVISTLKKFAGVENGE
ncbi:NitrOD5 domain-containing protein [Thermococcus sp. Bubb.Bath]|uniref:NitrOD5 domain-containing protein n=1 Tax=Thermococcus sp. Bubb.Bath TaxID=1638242 RepID=UPI001F10AEA6|nr:NitrOD5 domain-containing protein [Thermococcus sp. Bubb.Bath]